MHSRCNCTVFLFTQIQFFDNFIRFHVVSSIAYFLFFTWIEICSFKLCSNPKPEFALGQNSWQNLIFFLFQKDVEWKFSTFFATFFHWTFFQSKITGSPYFYAHLQKFLRWLSKFLQLPFLFNSFSKDLQPFFRFLLIPTAQHFGRHNEIHAKGQISNRKHPPNKRFGKIISLPHFQNRRCLKTSDGALSYKILIAISISAKQKIPFVFVGCVLSIYCGETWFSSWITLQKTARSLRHK